MDARLWNRRLRHRPFFAARSIAARSSFSHCRSGNAAVSCLGFDYDGNLSTHLAVLEERGYVAVYKEFVRRKPHTTYSPTEAGRDAFRHYLLALERIIRAADAARKADVESPGNGNPTPGKQNTSVL